MKRRTFLRALQRMGVQVDEASGGGSLVKLRFGVHYDSFHIHASAEIGPKLIRKILRRLGIDEDDFRKVL